MDFSKKKIRYIQISDHFRNRNQYESARKRNLCEVDSLVSYGSLEDTTKKNKQKNKQYLPLRRQRLCFVFEFKHDGQVRSFLYLIIFF